MENIKIQEAMSVRSSSWTEKEYTWREFVDKCKNPRKLNIAYDRLMTMDKEEKSKYKDTECFVGGYFVGRRRKKQDLIGRTLVTLDIEEENVDVPNWDVDDVYKVLDEYGKAAIMYTTISNGLDNPRCRVIFCVDREMTREEYEPVARKLAEKIGMEKIDRTTFDLNRAMFYPTICADGDWQFEEIAGPPVCVDEVLTEYEDWTDFSQWPKCDNDPLVDIVDRGDVQSDPREKKGWIGDFCRAYSITEAIEKFELPYEVAGNRATYTEGTGSYGCEIFDGDRWMYSYHATDPISGRLVNSYDLVRICLYGDDDESYQEMVSLMMDDDKVIDEHLKSESSKFNLQPNDEQTKVENQEPEEYWDWENELQVKRNKSGDVVSIQPTLPNFNAILENDSSLKGNIRMNNFTGQMCITGPVPWLAEKDTKIFKEHDGYTIPKYQFVDKDFDFLQMYISTKYKNLENKEKLRSALSVVANRHHFNEAKAYFRGLPKWDGVPRLDSLFIDFLGAEDNDYVRKVTRKVLVACCARVMATEPVKWDYVPILKSQQGIGKSTLLSKIGMAKAGWFNDSITSLDDRKYVAEQVRGKILCELGEMSFMNKADLEKAKSTLSATIDTVRFAYKEFTVDVPRRCVFIGTSNQDTILKDQTGNRRFLPIKCDGDRATKSVFTDCDQNYVDLIWAEVYAIWQEGTEDLYVTNDIKKYADQMAEEFRDKNPMEGLIKEFLEKPIPDDWYNGKGINEMKDWYAGQLDGAWVDWRHKMKFKDCVERDRVCTAEIGILCLGYTPGFMNGNRKTSNDIKNVLENLPGWKKVSSARFGVFGNTSGYIKEKDPDTA